MNFGGKWQPFGLAEQDMNIGGEWQPLGLAEQNMKLWRRMVIIRSKFF